MRWLPPPEGHSNPLTYAVAAPALVLSQHGLLALTGLATGRPLDFDWSFWLLPLRAFADLEYLPTWADPLAFLYGMAVAWAVAVLSYRRATRSTWGFTLAVFSVVPVLQVPAILLLALSPARQKDEWIDFEAAGSAAAILQGLLTGVTVVVLAVLASAVFFGAYGWGFSC